MPRFPRKGEGGLGVVWFLGRAGEGWAVLEGTSGGGEAGGRELFALTPASDGGFEV